MTPEEWAAVFNAGLQSLRGAHEPAGVVLAQALAGMAGECRKIAAERGPRDHTERREARP